MPDTIHMKITKSTVTHNHTATSVRERRPVVGVLRVTSAGLIGLALAIGVLALTRPVAVRGAGPWYVATTGSPANNCLAPATPCDTLQRAIDLASAGDTINVASGTYTVASGNEVATVNRALTFSGGWNAAFTTQIGSSVIDGQNTRRGFAISINAPTLISGFTIQNGFAGLNLLGGGIFADTGSPVTLINVDVLSSTAGGGGGLHAVADITLVQSSFAHNRCTNPDCTGAGASTVSSATISETQFVGNTGAQTGGGLYVSELAVIAQTTFQLNSAAGFGGGLSAGSLVLTDTSFTENSAGFQGGGAYVFAQADLLRPTVVQNTAYDEGGGLTLNGPAVVRNGYIASNSSSIAAGGGIAAYSSLDLLSTTVVSNTAITMGGGVRSTGPVTVTGGVFRSNLADLGGAFHFRYAGQNILRNAIVVSNTARMRGGGLLLNSAGTGSVDVTITNCILAANVASSDGSELSTLGPGPARITGSQVTFSSGTPGTGTGVMVGANAAGDVLSLTNTIFDGYAIGVQSGSQVSTSSINGVLWSNVLVPTATLNSPIVVSNTVGGASAFVNPATLDFHITHASAAYNQGIASTVSTDLDGEPRPLYGLADIGADELNLATDLVLSQSSTPAAATPGTPITFTLAYTNAGPRIAHAPIIMDSVPTSSLTDIAYTSSGAAITPTIGTTYTWQIADVAPGSGGTITITARLRDNLGAPAVVENSAVIESWVGDPLPANNTAAASVQVEAPITGLQAQSSSPQPPSTAVAFTATVSAGSNVSYAWSFGDGGSGSGAQSSHAYAAIGAYTATVTATNPLGSAVVQIPVTIADVAITGLAINGPATTPVNKATNYAATVTAGSNVTYAWQIDGSAAGSGATVPLVFSTTGSHTVTVTAINTAGSQNATLVVTVVPNRLYLPSVSK